MKSVGMLFLSHSGRPWFARFSNLNYLTRRYSKPDRLDNLKPLDQMKPASRSGWGTLSFYHVQQAGDSLHISYKGRVTRKQKMQQACRIDATNLLVALDHQIEHWRFERPIEAYNSISERDFEIVKVIDHPHMAGIRTLRRWKDKTIVASVVAADALFFVNWESGQIERMVRMPVEVYGENYPLDERVNLHDHYINNDSQTTHVNSAGPSPCGRFIYVTTLVQGAVGCFDMEEGSYREIGRGYVGCHGARVCAEGRVYFSDSCTGHLTFLDDSGSRVWRYATRSRWLQDSVQVKGDVYAFALSDSNELRVCDVVQDKQVYSKTFVKLPFIGHYFRKWFWMGNTTHFLSMCPPDGDPIPGVSVS